MEVHSCHHKGRWFNKYAKSNKYYKKRNIHIKENLIVENDYFDIRMMYSDIVNCYIGDNDWNCMIHNFAQGNGVAVTAFSYEPLLVVFRNLEAGSYSLIY